MYMMHYLQGLIGSARAAEGISFLNKGISGNRIVDLYARIKSDVINLKPDVISVLIGVNDTWHEFGSQNGNRNEPLFYQFSLLSPRHISC